MKKRLGPARSFVQPDPKGWLHWREVAGRSLSVSACPPLPTCAHWPHLINSMWRVPPAAVRETARASPHTARACVSAESGNVIVGFRFLEPVRSGSADIRAPARVAAKAAGSQAARRQWPWPNFHQAPSARSFMLRHQNDFSRTGLLALGQKLVFGRSSLKVAAVCRRPCLGEETGVGFCEGHPLKSIFGLPARSFASRETIQQLSAGCAVGLRCIPDHLAFESRRPPPTLSRELLDGDVRARGRR